MSSPQTIDGRFAAVTRSRTFARVRRSLGLEHRAVLDIGCSYGEHLAHFGPGSTGITISAAEAAEGARRGLDVRLGNAEETLPIERQYEAIYCSNLFEHLAAPHRFLYELRAALQPNGTLVLGVPVVPFPASLMRLRKFRGALASNHINFFTADTLRLTVERAGWNVREARGFRFANPLLDRIFRPVIPHLYVIAEPVQDYAYAPKRQAELSGI